MATNQTAKVDWRDGIVPVSRQFDDPYFSIRDGLGETNHVFLAGNGLPERFRDGFHIAELGFGTGLNMLASAVAWNKSGQAGSFKFTSFEAYPMGTEDIRMALLSFPQLQSLTGEFLEHWQSGRTRFKVGPADVELILGDARHTLSASDIKADAWFLDGFSPAKNPELWEPSLMRQVAQHTAKGGTFATYTAAGHVRDSLAKVGFSVSRVPGFGDKRHMTTGVLE